MRKTPTFNTARESGTPLAKGQQNLLRTTIMPMSKRAIVAGLAIVSAVTLCYEVVQIRIFSFSLHPVIAYSAISLAMLGFGLGATLLALRPRLDRGDMPRHVGTACLALAASMLLVNMLFARVSSGVMQTGTLNVNLGYTALALLPCIVPYFLAGLVTALILESELARVGRLYFWNLIGAAAGCVLVIPLLRPLGAETLVLLGALAAAVAGLVFLAGVAGRPKWVALGMVALMAACVPFARAILPFQADSNEYLTLYEVLDEARGIPKPVREWTEWDPVGRIDVLRHSVPHLYLSEPTEYRMITIDGGAMTMLLKDTRKPGWGADVFERSMYGVAYYLRPHPGRVLVIGAGGGTDVDTALHFGARRVTGVEISGSTVRAVGGPYAAFAAWPEKKDRVTLVNADGRSFAKRTAERYDVLQMSGVDTMTMHSAGSMVTAEDYLYTVEAFGDFLNVLEPDGILSVMRFGDEAMNLSTIAAQALRRAGVEHPEANIAALKQGFMSGIVVAKRPFTVAELAGLARIEDRREPTGVRIPHYDAVGVKISDPVEMLYPRGRTPSPRYARFFEEMAGGRETQALGRLGSSFVVPTDDHPYYMLGMWANSYKRGNAPNPVLNLLIASTGVICVASLALVFLPFFSVRRRSRAGAGPLGSVLAYFFGLGACFMLLEVGLIHRVIVFVGTPGAAVSVVLAAILSSSGIGSRVSDLVGWNDSRRLLFALGGLVVVAILYAFGAEPLFERLFHLPNWGRFVAAALALAPAGFFMGWFFPVGLRLAGARSEALVPWAIAVNGFASVAGSLAALPLSLAFGFRGVFLVALVGYAIVVLTYLPFARSKGGPKPVEAAPAAM
jgi:spermidine synthase